MSISELEKRITESLSVFIQSGVEQKKFAQPARLARTLIAIEKKFDALENAIPQAERVMLSVTKLQKSGFEALSRRDWKNIAWSLSLKLPDTDQKILFSPLGREVVQHLNNISFDILFVIYYPLLYSYFAFSADEVEAKPVEWIRLRELLKKKNSSVFKQMKRPQEWMQTLLDYSELLTFKPTVRLSKELLNSDSNDVVAASLESLNIASNSWLWHDLMQTAILSIQKLGESDFLSKIPRFILLMQKNPIYLAAILSAVLDGYAKTSIKEQAHEELKHLALDQWGNPQYESSAGWLNVESDTKKMVVQWFVRADLEAFFKLFSRDADVDRFNYWIKFIDQISFSQIFLGSSALTSRQIEHQKYRSINRGRLKSLMQSSATNNAFLLKIGNVYIVDFSDTGNACYAYNKLPYNSNAQQIFINDLKNKREVLFRNNYDEKIALSHSGAWESRFDEHLAKLGVFSTQTNLKNKSSDYGMY